MYRRPRLSPESCFPLSRPVSANNISIISPDFHRKKPGTDYSPCGGRENPSYSISVMCSSPVGNVTAIILWHLGTLLALKQLFIQVHSLGTNGWLQFLLIYYSCRSFGWCIRRASKDQTCVINLQQYVIRKRRYSY